MRLIFVKVNEFMKLTFVNLLAYSVPFLIVLSSIYLLSDRL